MSSSLFEEKLNSGEFLVTTEVGPPKGADVSEMAHHIDLLKGKVDAINITDHQSSMMRFPSIGGCLMVKERGGEPILQITCRDRNRLAIQAELLLAFSRDICNVLCLTGDAVDVGDHKEAKPVFDLDSVQLLRVIRTMESGTDMEGNELKGVPKFCIGASVHPEADFIEPQLVKFDKKVAAVKILAGIIVLSSARMAKYMNANVPGITVSQSIIDELADVEKGKGLQKGIEIAARFIQTIKEERLCHGVHIMAVGNEGIVPDILEAAQTAGTHA